MTSKERLLAGHNFMYKGEIYRYVNRIIKKYHPYQWVAFGVADTSKENYISVTVMVFGETFTVDFLYEDLSFER